MMMTALVIRTGFVIFVPKVEFERGLNRSEQNYYNDLFQLVSRESLCEASFEGISLDVHV